ncbi:adenine phosphoribosyltransferase [Streptomyces aidingensis]|uniref:Adenine phosphoribosyltransferase n=1 Tax=Streptomyces aidingensis TaxID=910347 RepID=A0A1I1RTU9_9ACTN|nr:adenine phosphoribosyltransferase [Streptomyces aidingensis]SFD37527.1 adenine phosphoribosyltransferase [Streptomyces aidingensis]
MSDATVPGAGGGTPGTPAGLPPAPAVPAPEEIRELLLSRIREVADYPRPGVRFKDITPLLADSKAFSLVTETMAAICRRRRATKVAGLEARGFILAAPVAVRAQVGFIPVRKAGKLPGATLSQSYELEYGSAEIELHAEDLTPEDRVLVIDDVLATGGTAEASLHLIRRTGAQVAGVTMLMELGFLAGRERLREALGPAPLDVLLTL